MAPPCLGHGGTISQIGRPARPVGNVDPKALPERSAPVRDGFLDPEQNSARSPDLLVPTYSEVESSAGLVETTSTNNRKVTTWTPVHHQQIALISMSSA